MPKMRFIGGLNAPSSYEVGKVYFLKNRFLKFPWFVKVGKNVKVGSKISMKKIPVTYKKSKRQRQYPVDLSISINDFSLVKMHFRQCKNAPSGYIERPDVTYMLPLRLARFPWFTLVKK